MPEGKLFIVPEHEHTRTDMLSDWLQAKRAVLWDVRGEGMIPQLQSYGFTVEELEELLLNLAADVHTHRTTIRSGAVIVEDGMVRPLYHMLKDTRWDIPIPSQPQQALEEVLQELYIKRNLQ